MSYTEIVLSVNSGIPVSCAQDFTSLPQKHIFYSSDTFDPEYKQITQLMNLQDPALQDLESNFIIQQKLVEAAKKLASEADLCKNVKKKRKQEYADAVKKLQEIENSINEYRIKCGKKPTQKSTLTLPGK